MESKSDPKRKEFMGPEPRQIEAANEKIIALGVTILSASILYSLKENLVEIYFLAPIAFIGILLFSAHQYDHLFWRGGHKRALEESLAKLTGSKELCWEQLICEERKRFGIPNAMFGFFIFLLFGSISVYCLWKIYIGFDVRVTAVYFGLLLMLFGGLILSIRSGRLAFDRSFQYSTGLLSKQTIYPGERQNSEAMTGTGVQVSVKTASIGHI
jgi:hypothetical protein